MGWLLLGRAKRSESFVPRSRHSGEAHYAHLATYHLVARVGFQIASFELPYMVSNIRIGSDGMVLWLRAPNAFRPSASLRTNSLGEW